MNTLWELETIFPKTNFSLFAKTLEMILYTPPSKLIRRKLVIPTKPALFGISYGIQNKHYTYDVLTVFL